MTVVQKRTGRVGEIEPSDTGKIIFTDRDDGEQYEVYSYDLIALPDGSEDAAALTMVAITERRPLTEPEPYVAALLADKTRIANSYVTAMMEPTDLSTADKRLWWTRQLAREDMTELPGIIAILGERLAAVRALQEV